MASNTNKNGKPIGKAIIWGILTIAAYFTLFYNEKTVMDHFSQGGGIYAAAVLITSLCFSLVHGSFANYLVDSLGIKPLNKEGH
ncbi:hypothetical protein DCCM_2638 [Desulfocucumis palustris]|uniref:Uncharacterized protein n=1 Tax=Desulfocucumis palustris TaxID=1898651 RepID=A0A2L2XH32_9FIRM|nr:hypothetical protein [Desulfocucumis palustris]GBF33536.1 hypothetical protein DCCM_2638 [Desulfocucumis palustris]